MPCLWAVAIACASTTCGDRSRSPTNPSDAAGRDGAGGQGAVTGAVMGGSFGAVTNAYWIGQPSAGSLPTQVFLLGAPLDCSSISASLWDKTLGDKSLLEIGVRGTTPSAYQIGVDAEASYLPNASSAYNPSADSGTVTLNTVIASSRITGSFEVHFGADTLSGSFDAVYCAGGVEP